MKVKLKNFIEIVENGTRDKGGAVKKGIPSLGAEHLNSNGTINWSIEKMKYISFELFNKMKTGIMKKDDVLIVKDGATTGKVAYVDDIPYNYSAINEHVFLLRPKKELLPKYLFYYLASKEGKQKVLFYFRGATVGGITKDFLNIDIPLTSISEQKKIANILDKVTNLIELRKKQLEKLDIFSKALFVEMFGDPVENPKNWRKENLNKFIMYANNGLSRRGKDITGNIVLRLTELKNGYIDYSKVNRMCIKENEEKYLLKDNDVLFARVNGNPINVGRSAVFHIKSEKVYFNDHIIRIHFKEEYINNFFISFLFNTNYGRVCVSKNIKTSAGQYTISQDGISSLTFPIPPIELQNQFAKKVEQIDKIKLSIQDSLNKLETLKKSLMQEYFS